MILLTILAVALLSLSAVTLRSSGQAAGQAEARANARMALMLAIGELQKHTGADTRVTAPADIVEAGAPKLMGAWTSWGGAEEEVLDHDYNGRPRQPIYSSKQQTSASGGHFLSWLVSGSNTSADPSSPSSLASKVATANSIPLLATGTLLAGDDRQIHVQAQRVNQKGAMAWWVSGENQKALLPQPYIPRSDTTAHWSDLAKSHASADPKPFGLDSLLATPTNYTPDPANPPLVSKAITRANSDLLTYDGDRKPSQHFHDLANYSTGLLTNTATGGWRKDMSIMAESWTNSNFPTGNLPFFRITRNGADTSSATKPTDTSVAKATSAGTMIYPWSSYLVNTASPNTYYTTGAVVSWANLREYVVKYKNITSLGGSDYSINFRGNNSIPNTPAAISNKLHVIPHMPVIARMHWVYSHRTVIDNTIFPLGHRIELLVTPVITLWNPYNVTLNNISQAGSVFYIATPTTPILAFRFYDRNGLPPVNIPNGPTDYKQIWRSANNVPQKYSQFSSNSGVAYIFPTGLRLAPGETKTYCITNPAPTPLPGGNVRADLQVSEGYRPLSGHLINTNIRLDSDDPVKVDLIFDAYGETKFSIGMNLDIRTRPGAGINLGTDPRLATYRFYPTTATAALYWPPIPASSGQIAQPLASAILNNWKPFFASTFGSRVSSNTAVASKGFTQISPFITDFDSRLNSAYAGLRHPVNAPFDYSFYPVAAGDSRLPNANNITNRGYIISGFQSGDGLSRVVLNDLPFRPMSSLGELQHFDLRGQNHAPPHQIYSIGNSDANPLIPANNVIPELDISVSDALNPQHDDSYCANHLLFDDWFFSSIAPDPTNFGSVIARNQLTVYQQFLAGTQNLANKAYRPIREDRQLNSTDRDALINTIITSADGWQKVASRLEVEGMFNVNSTSEKAWRALLGHVRDHKIPHFVEAGMSTSAKTNYAVARSSVAGDVKAGDAGIAGEFSASSQFAGYRVFTEPMLDSLAQKIVEQVRLRGPFLSLSEFVNRQLSSGDLALAGTIQMALNKMAETAANDPHTALKSRSVPTVTDPVGDEQYVYRDAAAGYSTYGMPGWIRQADILQPLAPILSARDDTFTIRAYGETRDANQNITARAWCEATVYRTRDFVDPADASDTINAPTSNANIVFGRRYAIRSFRWLSANEV
jgi:hypothetical protein